MLPRSRIVGPSAPKSSSRGVLEPPQPLRPETSDLVSTRTPLPKISDNSRRWIVLDADGKVLGRLAIVQEMIRQAEDHRLMLAHQRVEIATGLYRPYACQSPVDRRRAHLSSIEYAMLLLTSIRRKSLFASEIEMVRL